MSKCCQLYSGSKGNSIFIASSKGKFLVDVGMSAKQIEQGLHNIDENPEDIDAILITHEHSDHIKGLRVFATRYDIPVFAHEMVLASMINTGDVTDKMTASAINSSFDINGIEIVPFENSHDSIACLGYRLNMTDGRSISVCTDTGYITDSAKNAIMGSDLVFLESNHEVRMLQNGPYPYNLKQRILSINGHLSNFAAAEFATELVKNGTTRIVLSHLSEKNNTPEIARISTLTGLTQAGYKENIDFRLYVSSPTNDKRAIVL